MTTSTTKCGRCDTLLTARTTHFRFKGSTRPEARIPYCLSCKGVLDNPRPPSPRLIDPLRKHAIWPRNTRAYKTRYAALTS